MFIFIFDFANCLLLSYLSLSLFDLWLSLVHFHYFNTYIKPDSFYHSISLKLSFFIALTFSLSYPSFLFTFIFSFSHDSFLCSYFNPMHFIHFWDSFILHVLALWLQLTWHAPCLKLTPPQPEGPCPASNYILPAQAKRLSLSPAAGHN